MADKMAGWWELGELACEVVARLSMPVLGPRLPPQKPSVTQSGTTGSLCGQIPPVVKQNRCSTSWII
jgi:hypothetical protein